MLVVWYKFFSGVLAECIVFMSLFLLHVLGYFDLFVWIFFTINSDVDRPERKGTGAKVPGSEMSRECKGQGANRPESYWPIRSGERIGPGAKRLGTMLSTAKSANVGFSQVVQLISNYFPPLPRKRSQRCRHRMAWSHGFTFPHVPTHVVPTAVSTLHARHPWLPAMASKNSPLQ